MQKQYVKTSSSTAKLTAINGMYPTITCNHSMRSSKNIEIAAFKARREAKRLYNILINETVREVLKILDSNQQQALKSAEGITSFAEELKNKNNVLYQSLIELKCKTKSSVTH